jgi:hypothetical protein
MNPSHFSSLLILVTLIIILTSLRFEHLGSHLSSLDSLPAVTSACPSHTGSAPRLSHRLQGSQVPLLADVPLTRSCLEGWRLRDK